MTSDQIHLKNIPTNLLPNSDVFEVWRTQFGVNTWRINHADLWKTSGFQQFNVLQKFSPEFLTLEEEGINVMLIRLFILGDPVQICR